MKSAFKKDSGGKAYRINVEAIPKGYNPENDTNGFMNPTMLAYFWQVLYLKREEIKRDLNKIEGRVRRPHNGADILDNAQARIETTDNLRTAERLKTQRNQINVLLDEIEANGPKSQYGYCEDTGEEISIERLINQPTTTRTVEAQEAYEKRSKLFPGLKK